MFNIAKDIENYKKKKRHKNMPPKPIQKAPSAAAPLPAAVPEPPPSTLAAPGAPGTMKMKKGGRTHKSHHTPNLDHMALARRMGVHDAKMPNAHLHGYPHYQKNTAENRTHIDKSVVKHHTDVNGNPHSRYYKHGGRAHHNKREELAAGAVAKIRHEQYY